MEILRDPWGIPHIFAGTDEAAFFGLGYAMAEDRAFQMTYSLRVIQGRVSEILGEIPLTGARETSLQHDQKMRTFGFYRAAQRTVRNLDPESQSLLQAFCLGVNRYFEQDSRDLNPLFATLEVKPEPWTPADCLASWWHLAQFFATDGTRELIARRNQDAPTRNLAPPAGRRGLTAPSNAAPADDSAAVVKRSDVPASWVEQVEAYAAAHGLQPRRNSPGGGPRFSHAWVVGGKRTSTGSSVLVSDPQTPVRNPSLFYEFHLRGRTFNARGLGVPGSPILLIGFNENVAWGVTALGADQADLFMLKTDPAHPDQYFFDDGWRPMSLLREMIRIKGREPLELRVRETHLGPVATAFCFALPNEGEVALKRVPICETNRETFQAGLAMIRSRSAREFDRALADWRFPSANFVFGDARGNIGYRAAAAIPVRSRLDAAQGQYAAAATSAAQDWQEFLPPDLLPHVFNPAGGFVFSANHRPIESWYPISLGAMTGGAGDTVRSWRLRERLEALPRFTPEQVLQIHYDAVNPARREIVRIGLHLRDVLKRELSKEAALALERLEPWFHNGASSSLANPGAELATELNTFFRFVSTPLAFVHGGGESGLSLFLKTTAEKLNRDSKAPLTTDEQEFIDNSLASAWRSAREKYGSDPMNWNAQARAQVSRRTLGYMESLDRLPALDRDLSIPTPPLDVLDGGTIASQASQSYTQWVPMHDPDQALSILPIGQSEHPDHASRTSTLRLWREAKLHPAPLSRAAVDRLNPSTNNLTFAAGKRPVKDSSWIRAGLNTNAAVWGVPGRLLWGLPSHNGKLDGPRGLIRLRYPTRQAVSEPNLSPELDAYHLVNFIAIEPIVGNQKAFSELEPSQLDGTNGKRLWARPPGQRSYAHTNLFPGTLSNDPSRPGVEILTVEIGVEPFLNGAHIALMATQRSDAPDELQFTVHAEPDSAPLEYCILTATMGNKARTRQLWLKGRAVSSLELYPDYKADAFAPHRFFALDRLFRTGTGDVLAAVTTDEPNPASTDVSPAKPHWRYSGEPVTQYWKKPARSIAPDLHLAVNARYTYWLSQNPIPGGIAYENFEMRERFREGQIFVFGITFCTPEQLGFRSPPASR